MIELRPSRGTYSGWFPSKIFLEAINKFPPVGGIKKERLEPFLLILWGEGILTNELPFKRYEEGLYDGWRHSSQKKIGFLTPTKLGTTSEFFVASTDFFCNNQRLCWWTKHFVVVTKYFCYPYFNKWLSWYNKTFLSVIGILEKLRCAQSRQLSKLFFLRDYVNNK